MSYCPRSSLPANVLTYLAGRLAHLLPPRPPGCGGTPPLAVEVRLDAVGAVLLDGLSYRRAGRAVGISKTEVGDSMDLLLAKLVELGDLRERLEEMAGCGEGVALDGLPACNAPGAGPTRRCCTTPSATPTPPRAWRCRASMATFCGWTGLAWKLPRTRTCRVSGLDQVLDATSVASLLDRGFRGMAKGRQH